MRGPAPAPNLERQALTWVKRQALTWVKRQAQRRAQHTWVVAHELAVVVGAGEGRSAEQPAAEGGRGVGQRDDVVLLLREKPGATRNKTAKERPHSTPTHCSDSSLLGSLRLP